jgi:hypothetical protein
MRFFNEGIEVDVDGNPLSNPNSDVEPDGPYPSFLAFPAATTDGEEDFYLDDDEDDDDEDGFDYHVPIDVRDEIIGFRRPKREEAYAYRYDGLSTKECMYVEELCRLIISNHCCIMKILMQACCVLAKTSKPLVEFIKTTYAIVYWLMRKGRQYMRFMFDLLAIYKGDRQVRKKKPPRNRTIQELDESDAYKWTRFTKEQLQDLLDGWRLPNDIRLKWGEKATGEEVVILSLTKKGTGKTFTDLEKTFGGDYRTLSVMYDWFVEYLYEEFYDLISSQSLEHYLDRIDLYRSAIQAKLSEKPIGNQFVDPGTVENWRVFGFIDDNARSTCRPFGGKSGITKEDQAVQDAMYRYVLPNMLFAKELCFVSSTLFSILSQ